MGGYPFLYRGGWGSNVMKILKQGIGCVEHGVVGTQTFLRALGDGGAVGLGM